MTGKIALKLGQNRTEFGNSRDNLRKNLPLCDPCFCYMNITRSEQKFSPKKAKPFLKKKNRIH